MDEAARCRDHDVLNSGYTEDLTSSAVVYVLEIEGTVTVNASGTLGLFWAQNVSDANATTLQRGSTLRAWKMN